MATPLDHTAWFDNPKYSGVTIKVNEREIKAHKLVLSSQSEYFKRMLDANNGFSESSTSVIELKDDDTEAVLAVLRWIYGFGYYKFFGRDREAFSGINVYVAAGKYLRDGLRNVARDHLRNNML